MNLSTAQGALSFAARQRDEITEEWRRTRRLEFNGYSYSAWLFCQNEIRKTGPGLMDWGAGRRHERVKMLRCKMPTEAKLMPGGNTFDAHEAQRSVFSQGLKLFAKASNAVGFVLAAEVWFQQILDKNRPEGMTVEDWVKQERARLPKDLGEAKPDERGEALFMVLEHNALPQRKLWRAILQRNPDRVLPWEDFALGGDMEGRFLDIISNWRS